MNRAATVALPITPPASVTSLIGGKRLPARGPLIPVAYPANGQVVSQLAEADASEVDLAVKAARHAFDHSG